MLFAVFLIVLLSLVSVLSSVSGTRSVEIHRCHSDDIRSLYASFDSVISVHMGG